MNPLEKEKAKAEKESACYAYCTDTAFDLFNKKEFAKAAVFLENAARSSRELEKIKMKISKQCADNKWFEIKQMEGQLVVDKWMSEMRKKA
ncbi:hypothetical protein [Oceanobacillus damuensis]|uniref:hypothetical protein n=1 Tax=Oceanobacillus damuensis TaxID=937928 RepID=UPI00082B2228|nr:hypothetical protein [Oceanobacillus damuensis]